MTRKVLGCVFCLVCIVALLASIPWAYAGSGSVTAGFVGLQLIVAGGVSFFIYLFVECLRLL